MGIRVDFAELLSRQNHKGINMKSRLLPPLFALMCLLNSGVSAADDDRVLTPQGVLADLMMVRPFGLGMIAVGTALFVGTSPIAALASIGEPHDALQRSGEALVAAPVAFTFSRPLGDFRYKLDSEYIRH